jgi:hypothetical protein
VRSLQPSAVQPEPRQQTDKSSETPLADLKPPTREPDTYLAGPDRVRLLSLLRYPHPIDICCPSQSSSSCWLNSALVCMLLPWSRTVYRLFSSAFLEFNRMSPRERDRFDAMLLYACVLRHAGGGSFRDGFLLHKLGLERGVGQDDVSRGLQELMKIFPGQHLFEDQGDLRLRVGLRDAERALEVGVEVGDDVRVARGSLTVGLCVDQDALRTLMEERESPSPERQHQQQGDEGGISQGSNTLFSLEFERKGNVVGDEHHDLAEVVSEHFKYRGEITWWSHTLSAYASPRASICEKLFVLHAPRNARAHKVFVNLGDSCKSEGLVPLFLSSAMQELTLPCMFSSRTWEDADFAPESEGKRSRVEFVREFAIDARPEASGSVQPVRFEWGSEFHTSGCTMNVCELLAGDKQSAAIMCANWIMLIRQIAVYGVDVHEEALELLREARRTGLIDEAARAVASSELDASGVSGIDPEKVGSDRLRVLVVDVKPGPILRREYYSRYMFRTMLVQDIESEQVRGGGSAEDDSDPLTELALRFVSTGAEASGPWSCVDRLSEVFAAARVCEFPAAFSNPDRRNVLISKMRALAASAPGLRLREKLRAAAAGILDRVWCGPRAHEIYGVCRSRFVPVGIMLRVVRDYLQEPQTVTPLRGFEASFLYVRKKTVHRTPGMTELAEGELFVIENPRRISEHRFIVEVGERGVVTFDKGVFSSRAPVKMEVVSACVPTQKVGESASHWYSIVRTGPSEWRMIDSLRGEQILDEKDAISRIERGAILIILRRVSESPPPSVQPHKPPREIIAEVLARLRE